MSANLYDLICRKRKQKWAVLRLYTYSRNTKKEHGVWYLKVNLFIDFFDKSFVILVEICYQIDRSLILFRYFIGREIKHKTIPLQQRVSKYYEDYELNSSIYQTCEIIQIALITRSKMKMS